MNCVFFFPKFQFRFHYPMLTLLVGPFIVGLLTYEEKEL